MTAYDVSVRLEDHPGTYATVAEALATAGINVEGGAGWAEGGVGEAHFLVTDPEAATKVLVEAGYEVSGPKEALFAAVANRPGVVSTYTARLGEAGINIEAVYLAAGTRLVVVADDVRKARVIWDELERAG